MIFKYILRIVLNSYQLFDIFVQKPIFFKKFLSQRCL